MNVHRGRDAVMRDARVDRKVSEGTRRTLTVWQTVCFPPYLWFPEAGTGNRTETTGNTEFRTELPAKVQTMRLVWVTSHTDGTRPGRTGREGLSSTTGTWPHRVKTYYAQPRYLWQFTYLCRYT